MVLRLRGDGVPQPRLQRRLEHLGDVLVGQVGRVRVQRGVGAEVEGGDGAAREPGPGATAHPARLRTGTTGRSRGAVHVAALGRPAAVPVVGGAGVAAAAAGSLAVGAGRSVPAASASAGSAGSAGSASAAAARRLRAPVRADEQVHEPELKVPLGDAAREPNLRGALVPRAAGARLAILEGANVGSRSLAAPEARDVKGNPAGVHRGGAASQHPGRHLLRGHLDVPKDAAEGQALGQARARRARDQNLTPASLRVPLRGEVVDGPEDWRPLLRRGYEGLPRAVVPRVARLRRGSHLRRPQRRGRRAVVAVAVVVRVHLRTLARARRDA
mmetsp:Transcript_14248/g.60250  ORF Transcript_14248/g.60250 Transcript_14248/m.60250 type:complete len:329 (+) Transcript_14248:1328-2314(+)